MAKYLVQSADGTATEVRVLAEATKSSFIAFAAAASATQYSLVGSAGAASSLITGSALGDLCLVAESKSIRFSGDGGVTQHALMSAAGAWTLGALTVTGVTTIGNSAGGAALLLNSQNNAAQANQVDFQSGGSMRYRFITGQSYTGLSGSGLNADELGLTNAGVGALILKTTQTGAWTLGPTTKDVNHVVNGRRITLNADNSDSGNARIFLNPGDATTNGATFANVNASLAAAGEDTGTTPVIYFQSDIAGASAVVTRPIFQWNNYNTSVGSIAASGAWTSGPSNAGATVEHTLYGHLKIGTTAASVSPSTTNFRIIGNKNNSLLLADAYSASVTELLVGQYTSAASTYLRTRLNKGGIRLALGEAAASSDKVLQLLTSGLTGAADAAVTNTEVLSVTQAGTCTVGPSEFTGNHLINGQTLLTADDAAGTSYGSSKAGLRIFNANASAAGKISEITFGGRYAGNKPFAAISAVLAAGGGEQAGTLVFAMKETNNDTLGPRFVGSVDHAGLWQLGLSTATGTPLKIAAATQNNKVALLGVGETFGVASSGTATFRVSAGSAGCGVFLIFSAALNISAVVHVGGASSVTIISSLGSGFVTSAPTAFQLQITYSTTNSQVTITAGSSAGTALSVTAIGGVV